MKTRLIVFAVMILGPIALVLLGKLALLFFLLPGYAKLAILGPAMLAGFWYCAGAIARDIDQFKANRLAAPALAGADEPPNNVPAEEAKDVSQYRPAARAV